MGAIWSRVWSGRTKRSVSLRPSNWKGSTERYLNRHLIVPPAKVWANSGNGARTPSPQRPAVMRCCYAMMCLCDVHVAARCVMHRWGRPVPLQRTSQLSVKNSGGGGGGAKQGILAGFGGGGDGVPAGGQPGAGGNIHESK